jgi:hypothetical protein
MGQQAVSFLVVVLVPALMVYAVLKLAGVRAVTALMWASIVMAVVAVLIWITFTGSSAR